MSSKDIKRIFVDPSSLMKEFQLEIQFIKIIQIMGVPGFYSWLTKRYPMIKHMIDKQSLPQIDYLYLDMNGIIYKCVKDDSIIFKAQLKPKQLEQIWIEVFNYINMIVNILKPRKMIVMALDGVAPRSKMNNQRARRFKSARDYKDFIQRFYGYVQEKESSQNFKNNSISPGTKFMEELNEMINFFIQKKIQQDDYWKTLSVIFTGSDSPGEGEHKIMEFIRTHANTFLPEDTHCLYGADADLIMLGLILPMKNICIIREQYIPGVKQVRIMDSRKDKQIKFQLIYLGILKECFGLEYSALQTQMKIPYNLNNIVKDFVFLFFFIGNDFLPRCYAFNIRQKSIELLITAFKRFLVKAENYITGGQQFNLVEVARLLQEVAQNQFSFIEQKQDDISKFLSKKEEFQTEIQKRFKQKIVKEEEFVFYLKQMYLNEDASVRMGFYRDKFKVDPIQNTAEFYKILGFYVYGLKFVYEYYFVNLPSWSWYYPYYYAPFLSDISNYLIMFINSGHKLQKLQLDQPFQPFKQLLCILPKESCELLPKQFQPYLQNPQSILRNPIDYYPDTFQDDLYGSTRQHQAISLIPFLDQQLIFQVYSTEIVKVDPIDLKRNALKKSKLYEYKIDSPEIEVQSPFTHIESFACPILISQVDFRVPFKWTTLYRKNQINSGEENLLVMPTLYMRKFTAKSYTDSKHSISYAIRVEQENLKKQIKLGQIVYYGYPMQHHGRVEGILTKQELLLALSFNPYKYRQFLKGTPFIQGVDEMKNSRKKLFEHIIQVLRKQKEIKYLDINDTETFIFLVDTKSFTRTLDGSFERVYKLGYQQNYQIVPLSLVSKQRLYKSTQTVIKFKSIEEEFQVGEEVLVTCPSKDICGSRARVTGYSNDKKKVKIQILRKMHKIDPKVLLQITSTNDIFFTMRFVSEIIGVKADIIQTILSNINVIPPKDSNLPNSIDIGLNFMSRRDKKIVPNLVRINFDGNLQEKKSNPFKYLEFSIAAVQLLIEYKSKFPQIFQFIVERHQQLVQNKSSDNRIDWNQQIQASSIYKNAASGKDLAQSLMKVYVWLVQKQETHLPVSSIYSKQILQKRIVKLQQLFNQNMQAQKKKKKKYKQAKQEFIDPNFLYSIKLAKLGTLFLAEQPKNHAIGDQVICIAPQFFGHVGVVIGINDELYEVLFQKPSFGKTNLGGICQNLWGQQFSFKELLNIETWPQTFRQRKQYPKIIENLGWVQTPKDYYPYYKSKPIQDFNDLALLTKNPEICKHFPQKMLEYIENVRKSLKQIEISPDYQVVDNRNQQHIFKYDKKVSYIAKEQVQETAKEMKQLDKPIEIPLIKVEKDDFQKEIIQNKIAEIKINDTQIGEEEDAADIIG